MYRVQFIYGISPTQCKAARTYLGWQQEDLAQAAQVSVATVSNFENGFSPRRGTVFKMRKALENTGLEFTEGEGVRRRDNEIKLFRGVESCDKFFDDLLRTSRDHGGDIECIVKSPDMMMHSCGITERDNLRRLDQLNTIAKIKCLIPEAPAQLPPLPSIEFRTVSRNHMGPSSHYIYGNKYAQVTQEGRTNFSFVIYDIVFAMQDYRSHFHSLWEHALPLRS